MWHVSARLEEMPRLFIGRGEMMVITGGCHGTIFYHPRFLLIPQCVGEFHLGEMVNRVRPGSLVMRLPDSELASVPTLLLATVDGSLGLLASLPQPVFKFCADLQVGPLPPSSFRQHLQLGLLGFFRGIGL